MAGIYLKKIMADFYSTMRLPQAKVQLGNMKNAEYLNMSVRTLEMKHSYRNVLEHSHKKLILKIN